MAGSSGFILLLNICHWKFSTQSVIISLRPSGEREVEGEELAINWEVFLNIQEIKTFTFLISSPGVGVPKGPLMWV